MELHICGHARAHTNARKHAHTHLEGQAGHKLDSGVRHFAADRAAQTLEEPLMPHPVCVYVRGCVCVCARARVCLCV